LIDEILAGLPENARLRTQLSELRAQIAVLERENEELKAQIQKIQPSVGIDPDAAKILKIFFEHGETLTAEQIAQHIGSKVSVVQYHFDKLCERKFLRWTTAWGGYDIQPAGREFIVKNGLA